MISDGSWKMSANCLDLYPSVDFMHGRGSPDVSVALGICAAGGANECPVIAQCLDYAIETKAAGVWGGTTHAQRKEMTK